MDNRVKHVEMIQGVVNRLAGNSLLLKGWAVTLVSALIAAGVSGAEPRYGAIASLPIIAFWSLDAYYLRQERLYRRLYDRVRGLPEADIDFSMDVRDSSREVATWLAVALSRTLVLFYGMLELSVLACFWMISSCV